MFLFHLQLFTWRIGQAQTYEGADIISTNTDGLYSVFDSEENAKILERESKNINVEIEPEPCYLVSKDSNNRLEVMQSGHMSAGGGSLACFKGPNPTKSLTHPAIIDWALCEYLRNADDIHGKDNTEYLSQEFDLEKGKAIFEKAKTVFTNKAKYLNMFQIMLASSIGSQTYIFGETDNFAKYKEQITKPNGEIDVHLFNAACESNDIKILPHYNRVFLVNNNLISPVYKLSNACTRVVTPASKLTRERNNENMIQHDPYALALLSKYNLSIKDIPAGKEASISKVSGIDASWHVFTENHSLFELDDVTAQNLINSLDINNYLTLLASSFDKNWRNEIPEDKT